VSRVEKRKRNNCHLHAGDHGEGAGHARAGLHGQPAVDGEDLLRIGDALFGQVGRPGLLVGRQFGVVDQQGLHGRHVDLSARGVQRVGQLPQTLVDERRVGLHAAGLDGLHLAPTVGIDGAGNFPAVHLDLKKRENQ